MLLIGLISVLVLCARRSSGLTCYYCESFDIYDHRNNGHGSGHVNGHGFVSQVHVNIECRPELCSHEKVCGFELNLPTANHAEGPSGCQIESYCDKHTCCRDDACVEKAMKAANLPFSHLQTATTLNVPPTTTHHNLPTTTHHNLPTTTHHDLPTTTHRDLPTTTHHDLPTTTHRDLPTTTHRDLPTTAPTSSPYVCQDEVVSMISSCQALMSDGACLGHLGVHVCQKTCGFCDYVKTNFGSEGYCKDTLMNNGCASLSTKSFCADSLAISLCPRSCGLCAMKLQNTINSFLNRHSTTSSTTTTTTTTTATTTTTSTTSTTTTTTTTPCVDLIENDGCASISNVCKDDLAQRVCRRSCNLCGVSPTARHISETSITAVGAMQTTASTMPTSTNMPTTESTMTTTSTMPTTASTTTMPTTTSTMPSSSSSRPTTTTLPPPTTATSMSTATTTISTTETSKPTTLPATKYILTNTSPHSPTCVDQLKNNGCALLPEDVCQESIAHMVCPQFCNLCGET